LTDAERKRRTDVKRARLQSISEWFEGHKNRLRCVRCGESHPAVLQFHHRDPAEKDIALAEAVSAGWSVERILREAAKCEVLCANCHMKHHAREGHDVD